MWFTIIGECEELNKVNEIAEVISGIFIKKTPHIEQNQKIADSVTMILKIAFEQRERLVILLNDGSPHNDISQKEFDRVNIIINALCPMMHHNTGKDIYAKQSQPNVSENP